jgi:anti-anti-sigma factor
VTTLGNCDAQRHRDQIRCLVVGSVSTRSRPGGPSDQQAQGDLTTRADRPAVAAAGHGDIASRTVSNVNGRGTVIGTAAIDEGALRISYDAERRRMTVRGALDFANSGALADAMQTLLNSASGNVVIDVADLQIADAASLTLFLSSCTALRDTGVQLLIAGATPTARQACHAAGLDVLADG